MRQEPDDQGIEQLTAAHQGEWLALEVTLRDASGRPRRARLVAHSSDRGDVYASIGGMRDLCVLFAGEMIPSGYDAFL